MLVTCVAKELLSSILSLRYTLAMALFVLLALSATAVRTAVYKKQARDYADLQTSTYKALSDIRMRGEWGASKNFSHSVEKAPNPLAIFAFGLENEITRSYSQGGWYDPYLGPRKLQSPAFEYNLSFDLVTVISIVGSLLALVLAFDGVTGEAERGTLKVLLSGPLPRDTVILAKILAGLITMLLPCALAWTMSVFFTVGVARVGLGPDQLVRLACMAALSMLYIAFFHALGAAVSCLTQKSATSFAVSLFCWVLVVLIVPNVAPLISSRLAPAPQLSKLNIEKDALRDRIIRDSAQSWSIQTFETGKYNDIYTMWGVELLPRWDREFARQSARYDQIYQARVSNQIVLAQSLSRVSPSAAYMYAASSFAATGIADFMRVVAEHRAYFQQFTAVMADLEQKSKEMGERDSAANTAYSPEAYPAFDQSRADCGSAVKGSLLDIGYLSLGAVLLFMVAVAGFTRYRVA